MEARVHVGAPTPLPAGSMDGSDCLGRPAVAGAYRHLGMAGYSASALDLFRAHRFSSTRAFAKTKFRRRPARTRGSPNGPCYPSLRCDGVSDLLSHLYAAQCRPCPRRPRTLFCHCPADGCYLHRLDDQCRFTSWCTRGNSDYWIIAFGTCEFPSTAGGTLVGAVNSSALTLSKMQFVGRDQRQVAFEQLCDPLAGIEHAGFHRILRRADDLGDFGDRLFVIVDEVDDLAVRRRQLRQALPQDGDVVLLLQDHLGTVGVIWNFGHDLVVERVVGAAAQRGHCL